MPGVARLAAATVAPLLASDQFVLSSRRDDGVAVTRDGPNGATIVVDTHLYPTSPLLRRAATLGVTANPNVMGVAVGVWWPQVEAQRGGDVGCGPGDARGAHLHAMLPALLPGEPDIWWSVGSQERVVDGVGLTCGPARKVAAGVVALLRDVGLPWAQSMSDIRVALEADAFPTPVAAAEAAAAHGDPDVFAEAAAEARRWIDRLATSAIDPAAWRRRLEVARCVSESRADLSAGA